MALKKHDRVAILSPSAGLPAIFPWVYELGLKRLQEIFHLTPVEFPTARMHPSKLTPERRAEDINKAFADPTIKAIIATIGGNDQYRILPYLDAKTIQANPKPFLGYSDNTNLHLYLWNLGITSYYGCNLMNQLAMQGAMHDFTVQSIRKALFEPPIGPIAASSTWTDFDLPWDSPQNLQETRPLYPSEGWDWHNNQGQKVTGKLWGGCLEVIAYHLYTKKYLPDPSKLKNTILYLETSEEMPSSGFIYRFFAALHELGYLNQFQALLMGRPKAQFCGHFPPEGRETFAKLQKEAIKKALHDTKAPLLTVFDLNIGHTDPQVLVPNGGMATINGKVKELSLAG